MNVLIAVCGSIAAYKSVTLVRELLRAGHAVQVAMTRSATQFVGAETFSGLTGKPTLVDLFGGSGEPHVAAAQWADQLVIAPATADVLARLAMGNADDVVTATALCFEGPVLLAPAMHPRMWAHPATQENVRTLLARGVEFLGPVHGEVASGEHGVGRMLEPEEIAARVADGGHGSLRGRRLIVTAGPTVEALDPVRFLSNRSSGKMGFAIATQAAQQGAQVELIAGPVSLPTPHGVTRHPIASAAELRSKLWELLGAQLSGADAVIMCAAVADYRPKDVSAAKLSRGSAPRLLELVPNADIIAEVGAARNGRRPHLTAFALESGEWPGVLHSARQKLTKKKVDMIVANQAGEALEGDSTHVAFLTRDGLELESAGTKSAVARQLLELINDAMTTHAITEPIQP